MNLLQERDEWRKQIEAGEFNVHPMFETYKNKRGCSLWRSSRQLERLFEYIIYLEEKLSDKQC